jgi:hypothetical protein
MSTIPPPRDYLNRLPPEIFTIIFEHSSNHYGRTAIDICEDQVQRSRERAVSCRFKEMRTVSRDYGLLDRSSLVELIAVIRDDPPRGLLGKKLILDFEIETYDADLVVELMTLMPGLRTIEILDIDSLDITGAEVLLAALLKMASVEDFRVGYGTSIRWTEREIILYAINSPPIK